MVWGTYAVKIEVQMAFAQVGISKLATRRLVAGRYQAGRLGLVRPQSPQRGLKVCWGAGRALVGREGGDRKGISGHVGHVGC